ncbi:MAG: nitroreductase family protein [Verrucomicrobia bacterium]|nr:nitroreductase family protein [Verrucomicrobiota bacterium]MBS0638037.1 nitroreductase family protein [Verrucomicrobiota bacterium]
MKSLEAVIADYREPTIFSNKPVPNELIDSLLQTAEKVPYAFHLKPTHTHVITDSALKDAICKACFHMPLARQAPAIVIFTGDRFCAKEQEANLQHALEENEITLDDAERARTALKLHFDTSPIGFGWLGKLVGAPVLRLMTSMPQIPAVHKREFLTRQVMRAVMTFFWAGCSHELGIKLVESYDEWRIKWALNIPWHHIVVSVVLVGYTEK